MGEATRVPISIADCMAYAEECEAWARSATTAEAATRMVEIATSWRELARHLRASESAGAAKLRSGSSRPSGRKKRGDAPEPRE